MRLIDIFNSINIQNFQLNQEEINYIKFLVKKQPHIFDYMQYNINLLINNGKLDLHDLPQIVLIVADIIKINYININNKIDIINLIQYILDIIINSDILPLPDIEFEIINNIIDTSLQLLEIDIYFTKEKTKYCWNLFCKN